LIIPVVRIACWRLRRPDSGHQHRLGQTLRHFFFIERRLIHFGSSDLKQGA
jgi:hypothetical protein